MTFGLSLGHQVCVVIRCNRIWLRLWFRIWLRLRLRLRLRFCRNDGVNFSAGFALAPGIGEM